MKIPLKMQEMTDASVRYISLVDRASSRIPFRVVKKENDMLNLSTLAKVFKSEPASKPTVSGVIVFAQKDEASQDKVRDAIQAAGFSVETTIKNDDGETLTYAQDGDAFKDATLVRLSDQMILVVKGFSPQSASMDGADFGSAAASNAFHQGVDSALDILFQKICMTLNGATDEADAETKVSALMDGAKKYVVGMVGALPTAAFKADLAVKKALEEQVSKTGKADVYSLSDIDALLSTSPNGITENEWGALDTSDRIKWLMDSTNTRTGGGLASIPAAAVTGTVNKAEKPAATAQGDWDAMDDDAKAKHVDKMKAAKVEPAAEGNPLAEVLAAIKGVTAKVDTFSVQLADLSTKQTAIDTRVTELTQKSEALADKVKSTVIAPPAQGDPVPAGRGDAVKQDQRSGAFDTGMMNRGRR